jgi:hypothetical protein
MPTSCGGGRRPGVRGLKGQGHEIFVSCLFIESIFILVLKDIPENDVEFVEYIHRVIHFLV